MAQVSLTAVTRRFGSVAAVDGVDILVPDGALGTFLGPSGCGKTTTLRMVAGLEQPTAGEIRIGERLVSGAGVFVPSERRNIGMVFQSYAVWPHMTVLENVAFPLRVRRVPRAARLERARAALGTVRLDGLSDRYPAQLSGGQQQRVALARALVFEPDILLLDEPLSNLDAKLREEMRAEIRELQARLRLTTLYVTHDQQEALALSDLVFVMQGGRVQQVGSPRAVNEAPANRFVADFLGWANFLPAIAAAPDHVELFGSRLACSLPAGTRAGTPLQVAIRPTDLVVGTGPLSARVRSATYMGTCTQLELELGEVRLIAEVPTDQCPSPGATVALGIPSAKTRVLHG